MKKNKKEILKIAKKLVQLSLVNQKLDAGKIKRNIDITKKSYKNEAINVLRTYLSLLKIILAQETLMIESTQPLPKTYAKQLKTYFEKKVSRSLNVETIQTPNILGGIKITLGDTLWDYSIKGKISEMKEALSGGYSG